MKISLIKKISYFILSFLSLGILISLFILNKLSQTKMGVMRYLVYVKFNYPKTYFTSDLIIVYKLILISLIALILLMVLRKRNTKPVFFIQCFISIIFSGASLSLYYFPSLKNTTLLYYFLIIGLSIISIFQFLKILILYKNN